MKPFFLWPYATSVFDYNVHDYGTNGIFGVAVSVGSEYANTQLQKNGLNYGFYGNSDWNITDIIALSDNVSKPV